LDLPTATRGEVGIARASIAMAPAGGVTGSLFSMIFTPEVRYSGASVGYTISQILGSAFGATAASVERERP
jgi:hypothetical protein